MAKKHQPPGMSPTAMPPEGTTLEEELLLPTDEFWEAHKNKIIGGAIVFLVVAFAFIGWRGWQEKRKSDATAAFAAASTPEEWRSVMQSYAGTPAANNSSLLLAAALREQGDLAKSDAVYQELLDARHPFALQAAAALGIAQNAILQADDTGYEKAIASLQQVVTRFPSEYAASFALYMEGEYLLKDDREEDAVRVFRNLLIDYPDSLPGRMASMQLQRLAPQEESASPAAAAAASPATGQ